MHQKTTEFPEGFLWGASSSAFQIEGGWNLGGKGMTVADFNSFKRSHIQADTKVASDFYHHWKEDIDYMAELGLKMYRFSIAWARIIPDGDGAVLEEGIKFYDRIIDCLLSRGIQPFVTLYHFDLPYALAENTMAGNLAGVSWPLNGMPGYASGLLATGLNTGRSTMNRT